MRFPKMLISFISIIIFLGLQSGSIAETKPWLMENTKCKIAKFNSKPWPEGCKDCHAAKWKEYEEYKKSITISESVQETVVSQKPTKEILKNVKVIRIQVEQSYGKAIGRRLPLYEIAKRILEKGGFKTVWNGANEFDATLKIKAEGTPLGSYPLINSRLYLYSGAKIDFELSVLDSSEATLNFTKFNSSISPYPEGGKSIYVNEALMNPNNAPFIDTFKKSNFISQITQLMGGDDRDSMNPYDSIKKMEEIDFLRAVDKGDIATVNALLKKGSSANAHGGYEYVGTTALARAAWKGHADIVNLLIENGADVNKRDWLGGTALMMAAWNGKANIVKLLIDRGADINIKEDADGQYTAMKHAIKNGHTNIVNLLKQAGAKE